VTVYRLFLGIVELTLFVCVCVCVCERELDPLSSFLPPPLGEPCVCVCVCVCVSCIPSVSIVKFYLRYIHSIMVEVFDIGILSSSIEIYSPSNRWQPRMLVRVATWREVCSVLSHFEDIQLSE
jgi:hypothetical protein